MKKITLLCLLLVSSIFVNAQSYLGFLSDNYSGVHGVISNPANIVDSRFKTDVNLAGASFYLENDLYGVNVMDATKPGYVIEDGLNKTLLIDNRASLNVDVMGPSFMFNITPKSSIAVFSRARVFTNISGINGVVIDDIVDNFDDSGTIDYPISNTGVFAQSWAELGLTYARILKDDGEHFLKGGLSLKYLQGTGSAYAYGRNVSVDYDESTESTPSTVVSTGELVIGAFDEDVFYDDYADRGGYDLPKANGFGIDLGFVYEWRPDYEDYVKTNSKGDTLVLKDKNKYKLKVGLSITDIGSISYKGDASDARGVERVYDVNTSIIDDEFDTDSQLIDELNRLYNNPEITYGYTTYLPTALHINADWSFTDKFYLNGNADLGLVKSGKERASRITNMVSLTPRFESKWFSFYLPLNAVHSGFSAGAGLRAGPLYVGSGSVLSVLVSDNTKSADVYAGLKVPIYQPRLKDKDGDGIYDKLDLCPEEAGPVENNGCPWGDADEDTILDNEDECPEQAGPLENKGCPWGDADEDAILDNEDECPEQAGSLENKGCPWGDADGDTVLDNVDKCPEIPGPVDNIGCPWGDADGDTVLDKDDACVDIVGTVANKGCPEPEEVTVEIQKTLNEYAKTILFNSGKSSIKVESTQVLNEIVKILNEYPNANFSIEGHTDSVGSFALNQSLSESRASSVMLFLIENGVASKRLTATGFGESKPIATNDTPKGRALNRRVEINLVK